MLLGFRLVDIKVWIIDCVFNDLALDYRT
jgi:hypothetical protein